MANVVFKRGLHASLPNASANIDDGTFYLTTDTNRLYVGRVGTNGNELVELNKSITSVASTGALPSSSAVALGQFYYIEDQNILCVFTGITQQNSSGWTQINPDTMLATNDQNVSLASVGAVNTHDTGVTVTSTVADTKSRTNAGHFTIRGNENLNVSVDNNGDILLEPNIGAITSSVNTTYTIGTTNHVNTTTNEPDGAILNLTSSDTTPIVDTVTFMGSGQASVSQANDVITINALDPHATTEVEFNQNGSLTVATGVNGVSHTDGTFTPIVKLGSNSTEYKFTPGANDATTGTLTLPVYTQTEVDNAILTAKQQMNSMTFLGTVSSSDSSTKLTTAKNVGDTYKATSHITGIPVAGGDTTTAEIGDLIIAVGTDGNVTWEVVPSGDDQTIDGELEDTTYLGMKVKDQSGEIVGFDVVAGAKIALTGTPSNSDKHTSITIAQSTAGYTAGTTTGSSNNVTLSAGGQSATTATFEAITSIEVDAYGNIPSNGIQKKTFTVTDTHNHLSAIEVETSTSSNVATITVDATTSDGDDVTAGSFSIGSTGSLSITTAANSNATTIDMVWGSF